MCRKCIDFLQKLCDNIISSRKESIHIMKTITGTNRKRGRHGASESQKDEIVDMYMSGMPMADILKNCGMSRSTIYSILRERTKTPAQPGVHSDVSQTDTLYSDISHPDVSQPSAQPSGIGCISELYLPPHGSISELRDRTGLSQEQFARKFHLSTDMLQSWEQDPSDAPEYAVYMIARILELEQDCRQTAQA
jgi:putative transcriptional regulator